MATLPINYGQSIYIPAGGNAWVGGLTSGPSGCSGQTNGVTTGIPDEFMILDSTGKNPQTTTTVNYGDQVTIFNLSQNAFWGASTSGTCLTIAAAGSSPIVLTLTGFGSFTPGAPIQASTYPDVNQQQNVVALGGSPAGSAVGIGTNSTGDGAVMIIGGSTDTLLSFSLASSTPGPPPPPPTLVGIQNLYPSLTTINTGGSYLTVCDECPKNVHGFSVDVHAGNISLGVGSQWQIVDDGTGFIGILNTLTNSYLSACSGCPVNNPPVTIRGWTVDVHASSIVAGDGSQWQIVPATGGSGIINTLTQTYLTICYNCAPVAGVSVDVHATTISAGGGSLWDIQYQTPPPSPIPLVPSGGGGGSGSGGGKSKWFFWAGVGLWIVGAMLTLILPQRFLMTRIFSIIFALAGIGLIFYASY